MEIKNLKVGQIIKNYKELCNTLEIKIKGGDSKRSQLKDLARYFKYHKDKNKFIIDEIYDKPLPEEVNGNFKNFNNLKINKEEYNKNGVYKIVQDNKIYVGSTIIGFRNRFMQHRQKHIDPNLPTRDMLLNGGYFDVIWIAPDNTTEKEIREKEDKYIKYYKNNKDWICMNTKNAWSLLRKPKIKYKNIKVKESLYNKAMQLLIHNNIINFQ